MPDIKTSNGRCLVKRTQKQESYPPKTTTIGSPLGIDHHQPESELGGTGGQAEQHAAKWFHHSWGGHGVLACHVDISEYPLEGACAVDGSAASGPKTKVGGGDRTLDRVVGGQAK